MTTNFQFRAGAGVIALAASALLPSLALAEGGPETGPWQFAASVYAYLPTLSANSSFPVSGAGADFAIDADTILENLKMTFMGALEAHNGRWGMVTDVVYVDIGDHKSGVRDFTIGDIGLPATASANVDLDLKALVWTFAGEYRLATAPSYQVDLLAGARYLDVEQTLKWSISGDLGEIPAAGRSGSSKAGDNNWDAIVGVRGRLDLGEGGKWAMPFYLDVGTGDSDVTWQGMAGVSYAFQWGEMIAAWRYLDYQFDGGEIENLSANGPLIGVTFRW